MKSRTKKILAGIGLGIIGMGCLTGCSLTDDQQKALDLLSGKSDNIVSLLENNMELESSELSKVVAYEKISFAFDQFEFGMIDKFRLTYTNHNYKGYFDKIQDKTKSVFEYQFKDHVKYIQSNIESSDVNRNGYSNMIFDYDNDYYVVYGKQGNKVQPDIELDPINNLSELEQYSLSSIMQVGIINIDVFSAEDIYNVEMTEEGSMNFYVRYSEESVGIPEGINGKVEYLYKIQIKNNLIHKLERYLYRKTFNLDGEVMTVESNYITINYEYDVEIDFSSCKQKHNAWLNTKN